MNDLMGGRRAGLAQALMNRRMGGRMPNKYGGMMGVRDRGTPIIRPAGPMMSPPNEMQNEVNPMTGSVRAQQMFPNGVGLQKPNDVAMTPGINPMAKPLMSNAMKRPPAYTQPGIPVMPANDLA